MRRSGDAADHLQQSCLAGAVAADDAEAFALADLEVDVAQDPMLLVEALPSAEENLLQLVVSVPIKLKRLAEPFAAASPTSDDIDEDRLVSHEEAIAECENEE